MSELQPVPTWMKVFLGLQLALAALFFLLGWSQTVSLAQGRSASWQDLVGLSLPLFLVVAVWVASIILWRRGQPQFAGSLTIVPWPLALLAFDVLGAM